MIRLNGFGHINFRVHKRLLNMNPDERTQYELNLKNENKIRYDGFKQWQKGFMKRRPEYKIDY